MNDNYLNNDYPQEPIDRSVNGNVDPKHNRPRPKRPGVRIHTDTDLVQIMPDPELPEKAVWYGVQNDILIMCNEVYPENMKLALSLESSMRYEAIRPDHIYYDQVIERLEFRTLDFIEFTRSPGQGILIRLRQGIEPYDALEDLEINGMLLKTVTGNYDNDYKAKIAISASEIWQVSRLELTNYLHSSRKRFVPYYQY